MTPLDPKALNGSNDLQLAVFGNDAQGQILLSADFDDLGKGASGAPRRAELGVDARRVLHIGQHHGYYACLDQKRPSPVACSTPTILGTT